MASLCRRPVGVGGRGARESGLPPRGGRRQDACVTEELRDLVVVGAGVVGMAHAMTALRRGMSVTVLDRDAEAVGASELRPHLPHRPERRAARAGAALPRGLAGGGRGGRVLGR
ncbi:FAD-dependent oxidoreductase [Desertihabitans brevis]|uniref:FAD-dependent oxidoreductase n=1 Tax=Desertihabitans brevis TaxID=2268447 RepID=UPI0038992324